MDFLFMIINRDKEAPGKENNNMAKKKIMSWRDYTRDAHFRKVFQTGAQFVNVKPEVVYEAVQRPFRPHQPDVAEHPVSDVAALAGAIPVSLPDLGIYDAAHPRYCGLVNRRRVELWQAGAKHTTRR
jgi:hypothetical protein